jgi:hypothetical protein
MPTQPFHHLSEVVSRLSQRPNLRLTRLTAPPIGNTREGHQGSPPTGAVATVTDQRSLPAEQDHNSLFEIFSQEAP